MLVTPGPGLLGKLFVGKLGTNGPAEREREREKKEREYLHCITLLQSANKLLDRI